MRVVFTLAAFHQVVDKNNLTIALHNCVKKVNWTINLDYK